MRLATVVVACRKCDAYPPLPIQISDVAGGAQAMGDRIEAWQSGHAQETPLEVAAMPSNTPDGFHP